jgi:predicted ribosome quality control (RQC) complex YloA/Tae2 family protein
MAGATLEDVYSAARDELSLVFADANEEHTLRVSVRPGDRFVFRQPGGARPRRNVSTLFGGALRRALVAVRIADRDRVLDLDLADGHVIRVLLYGPRANIMLGRGGVVEASFREKLAAPGTPMPEPRPAPEVLGARALAERWPSGSQEMARAVARAYPLFDPLVAAEVVRRAELAVSDACLAGTDDLERIARAADGVRSELLAPRPRVYRDGREPVALSLLPLDPPPAPEEETFDSVDEAVRSFVRARLAHGAFRAEFEPIRRTLEAAAVRNRTRADRMLRELTGTSRADRYERWGHLLMAARPETRGHESVDLPDLFADGETARIPVDPAVGAVENAERWYDKARQTRRAREEAELRLGAVDAARREAERLLAELSGIEDVRALRAFRTGHADALVRFGRERPGDAPALPFRRFDLGGGYEAWVGRSAKENDDLTFTHARRHDWWLHARGAAGSHVVLRCPRRAERPPRRVVETAAAIAAWFSKASGSAMVPVIVAERRFVRKPRGAAPGAVVVDREEVVIVEPRLPARAPDDL